MSYIHSIDLSKLGLPGCSSGTGKVWVGQRSDPFWISLGRVFDYLNLIPIQASQFAGLTINNNCTTNNDLREKNVITLALEIPIACFNLNNGVMYTWSGVRNLIHAPGDVNQTTHIAGVQVSRLGNPLVNELVIGLIEKDRFSRQRPTLDADSNLGFAKYVLYPTLPEIITIRYLSAVKSILNAPSLTTLSPPTPRFDLAAAFLTGIPGINLGSSSAFVGEVIRVNLSIPSVPWGQQNNLGLGGSISTNGNDYAGFPNGRRPGDDVVDIALMAMLGLLCTPSFGFINVSISALSPGLSGLFPGAVVCQPTNSPVAGVRLVDGANVQDINYNNAFPYFTTPTPGSYVSGPTSDQTVCYPASQHGRCPLAAGASPSATPSVGSSTTPSAVNSGSESSPVASFTCNSGSSLNSWVELFDFSF
jgi:hypothetical protein